MNIIHLISAGGVMLTTLFPAISMAQTNEQVALLVKEKQVERIGEHLYFRLLVDVSGMRVSSSRSVVCTPVIEAGDSLCALPPIVLNGRARHILYERSERAQRQPLSEYAYRRKNGEAQQIEYRVEIPYADWMKRSNVSLVMDECGCGWQQLHENRSSLFALNFVKPVVLTPQLAYITPQAEAVKARKLEGKAYLDFPVSRTEIHPDYRNNPTELAKIRKSIDAVKEDKYATITGVSIKGYASPEGTYQGNAYLAEHRAKALLNYVKGLYALDHARMTVDFEPEDWAGLEKAVEQSSLSDKDELLAIIRADQPADWDAREWKLKTLNGGVSYRELLRDVYPGLRHSDYVVDYQIRNFSVDEARSLIFSDPSKLSLNEMFLVAQTYEVGSRAFNEIFETAVRLYPNDPVSNLNAAITAIGNRQLSEAKRYLSKAADSAEKQLAWAAIAMLEDRLDEAETLLHALEHHPSCGQMAQANLKQIADRRASL